MSTGYVRLAALWLIPLAIVSCSSDSPQRDSAMPAGASEAEPADVPDAAAPAAAPSAALLPEATGCAPGARCLSVTSSGRPSASGNYVAQCRGKFADFIVPKDTIPSSYDGPWFQPSLLEKAATGVPSGSRPWQAFDPRDPDERLAYALALRNYALTSKVAKSLTPQLTADSNYRDPAGGPVPASQRNQAWYPAPRMFYGPTDSPGTREAAHGMTLERTVRVGELGGNTAAFQNYAVAYYDARGGRVFQQLWKTTTPGVDSPKLSGMRFTEGSFVFKLLYSAAKPSNFPDDLLAGSLKLDILPNPDGPKVSVRLMQIDIAVKDKRAGPTGWYFATYAYDAEQSGASPWRKMVPVGLMWGNDPGGAPIDESWINTDAPAYALAHLGVDGRLNGPVDNPASACMSCHSTAQAPSVAPMLPTGACNQPPHRDKWFRNLKGTTAFGRFQPSGQTCVTASPGVTLTAADYSLQLSATVARALPTATGGQTFNPCTWDEDDPPTALVAPTRASELTVRDVKQFEVTRDPQQE
ncbi:hypothetical protein M2650_06430 [Luteimonas sp. SX5]|uniref:Cytochrome c domain-containing protein n=1 Tax=Luteimonas galliterrae TaxID=2940486 RepID=A0ABT0MHW1_9GAMM|nr:hypothetical protein [Luteimonas galliterrae]MCL1634268.1 hypothetical protein [Luteimonas galliterrae]